MCRFLSVIQMLSAIRAKQKYLLVYQDIKLYSNPGRRARLRNCGQALANVSNTRHIQIKLKRTGVAFARIPTI
jgi:hypothetical protein